MGGEKDKLDVFMESQNNVNQRLTRNIEVLTEKMETNADDITELKLMGDFVANAKTIFRTVTVALILGIGATLWQVVQDNNGISKSDIAELVKALNEKREP